MILILYIYIYIYIYQFIEDQNCTSLIKRKTSDIHMSLYESYLTNAAKL